MLNSDELDYYFLISVAAILKLALHLVFTKCTHMDHMSSKATLMPPSKNIFRILR